LGFFYIVERNFKFQRSFAISFDGHNKTYRFVSFSHSRIGADVSLRSRVCFD
jgi:hypothetical protein